MKQFIYPEWERNPQTVAFTGIKLVIASRKRILEVIHFIISEIAKEDKLKRKNLRT